LSKCRRRRKRARIKKPMTARPPNVPPRMAGRFEEEVTAAAAVIDGDAAVIAALAVDPVADGEEFKSESNVYIK